MSLVYVLAALLLVGICSADQIVKLDSKTYAVVELNGRTTISKQMDGEDMNSIEFAPKNVMSTNDSYTFTETDIAAMNFTLLPSAAATEDVNSNRVTGEMTDVNGGTLKLHVDVFTAGGNVTMDGNTTVVTEGDIRVTLEVSGYTFEAGSTMLKVKFMIGGAEAPQMEEDDDHHMTDGSVYELGGDGMLILSKKAKVDNAYVDAMFDVSDKMVTVSFDKTAATTYTYQFFIKPADIKVDTGSSTRVTSLSVLALIVTAMTAMLL